ncbi:MAG: hypothetical protein ACREQA_03110 [Candidatus Binatia bacterium]
MPAPDPAHRVAEVRQLNSTIRAGGPDAIPAFHELSNLLLNITVLAPGSTVKLIRLAQDPTKAVLGGRTAREPLCLNDARYLRVSAKLYLDRTTEPNFLKVEETSYQYQLDPEGDRWIFRYDYLRNPPHAYPASHLQINGQLAEAEAFGDLPLKKVYFPTGRVSLEAVIRLLVEQFKVPCNQPSKIWRPVLAESERDFLKVAHQALSGPER